MSTYGSTPATGEPDPHGSRAATGALHGDAPATGGRTPYQNVQDSPEFAALRSRFRRFVFPAAAFFLVWYFTYVLLAAYAPGFMGTKVLGNITIGLLFGLGQFVTTFAITTAYVRWANKDFDPHATSLRERIEGPDAPGHQAGGH
ncbi:DUF485 domain-containing protein [Kineococcus sp. NUM-3379]